MITCKDFIKKLHKVDTLDFSHILLYKSIQPHPLRAKIAKMQIREASLIPDAPDANILEIMKLNKIRDYMHQNDPVSGKINNDIKQVINKELLKNLPSSKNHINLQIHNDRNVIIKTGALEELRKRLAAKKDHPQRLLDL